jgi:hypothetical protein
MAVLFDPADEYLCSVLELAKVPGEISLADLEGIVEAGLEAKNSISTEDIGDTIDALADMGIEIDNGLTQEQEDAELLRSMRERTKDSPITPHLTFDAMASLARAIARQKAAEGAPPRPAQGRRGSGSSARDPLEANIHPKRARPPGTSDPERAQRSALRLASDAMTINQTRTESWPETSASSSGSISRRESLPWTYISAR